MRWEGFYITYIKYIYKKVLHQIYFFNKDGIRYIFPGVLCNQTGLDILNNEDIATVIIMSYKSR